MCQELAQSSLGSGKGVARRDEMVVLPQEEGPCGRASLRLLRPRCASETRLIRRGTPGRIMLFNALSGGVRTEQGGTDVMFGDGKCLKDAPQNVPETTDVIASLEQVTPGMS